MSRHHQLILMLLLASATSASFAQDAANAQRAISAPDAPTQAGTAAKRREESAAEAGNQEARAETQAQDEIKTLSGISILGNQEAPKSLVIVPWKSSEIGDMPGLSRLLDDSVQPIDKEVFMRELEYFEIRSNSQ